MLVVNESMSSPHKNPSIVDPSQTAFPFNQGFASESTQSCTRTTIHPTSRLQDFWLKRQMLGQVLHNG